MGYGIKLKVWGKYALFTRPEMKVERVSYDVITPSAARGIIEAIYWKPAIKWKVDRIQVCRKISFTNVRRNEVGCKISGDTVCTVMDGAKKPLYIDTSAEIQQRASMLLQDVCYIIEAHFEMTQQAGERDTPEKHYAIAARRMRNGQCYHMPCFGCREFPAHFRLVEEDEPEPPGIPESRDLGYMLYDMDYSDSQNIQPVFFRARMENGVIDLRNCEVVR